MALMFCGDIVWRYLALHIFVGLLIVPASGWAASKYRIGFFIPDDTPFWSRVALFAKAAAKDLDVDITVFDADADRILITRQFNRALQPDEKFDALIFPNFLTTASVMIESCELQKMPCILYNSDVDGATKLKLDGPGKSSGYWVAQLIPDDEGSAVSITKELLAIARGAQVNGLSLVAVNGYRADAPAIKRERGLRKVLAGQDSLRLNQIFYTNWSEEEAYERTLGFLPRYPDTNIIWSANYRTTEGILRALATTNRKPGVDVFINSYDIDPISLQNIESGSIAVAAGGHYVEGAWSVVMAYDYLMGQRYTPEDAVIYTPLLIVKKSNLSLVRQALVQLENNPETLDKADFSRFSLVRNPQLKKYSFSLESVLSEIILP